MRKYSGNGMIEEAVTVLRNQCEWASILHAYMQTYTAWKKTRRIRRLYAFRALISLGSQRNVKVVCK